MKMEISVFKFQCKNQLKKVGFVYQFYCLLLYVVSNTLYGIVAFYLFP